MDGAKTARMQVLRRGQLSQHCLSGLSRPRTAPCNLASAVLRKTIQDDVLIAVDNHRTAGEAHWLIMPRSTHARHIRDIEALTQEDVPLRELRRVTETSQKHDADNRQCGQ